MADKVVPVEVRALVLAFDGDAPRGAVTRFCREHSVSRSWFYEVRARGAAEGSLAAMAPRPRGRGIRSPLAIPLAVEEAAVLIRKELADQGWDHGPVTVRHHLLQRGLDAPAASTLARVFTRRGMVTPQPGKRPRSATRRFEFAMVHECWQLDSFEWTVADGSVVHVYQLQDDKSRVLIASHVEPGETAAGAITVLDKGIAAYQVPRMLLSDNGTAFNTTRRGQRSQLVTHLAALGVRCITGRPGHPQTQGKNERVHQTTQRWLRKQPPAADAAALLTQLEEEFMPGYNGRRPHQSLPVDIVHGKPRMRTPDRALHLGPVAIAPQPPAAPPPPPTRRPVLQPRRVDANGKIRVRYAGVMLGIEHAGRDVLILLTEHHLDVFDTAGTHLRGQPLTPGQRYYSNGRPKTYRRTPRKRPD